MANRFALVPVPEGYKVRIRHTFDPVELRTCAARDGAEPPRYMTEASVVNLATGITEWVEKAYCSPRDVPCRKTGRAIAHNRAVKHFSRYGALHRQTF